MRISPFPRFVRGRSIGFVAAVLLSAFSDSDAATLMILTPSQISASGSLLTTDGGGVHSRLHPLLAPHFTSYSWSMLATQGVASQADAFYVNLIAGGGTMGATYTSNELLTLAAIIASGKRVVIHFEWAAWDKSNTQLAALTGGTLVSASGVTQVSPEGTTDLVKGVTGPIGVGFGSGIEGGTRVFGNIVTLVGPYQNALLIGDSNILDDEDFASNPNNSIFRANVAEFLSVPEPSTLLLTPLAFFGFVLRRKRVHRG